MTVAPDPVLDECRAQDRALAAAGLAIWLGGEPTFTRADASEPCWLVEPLGGDKEERARELLLALSRRLPDGAELCRAVGRQYPEEERPRFAYGARWSRPPDGSDDARLATLSAAPARPAPAPAEALDGDRVPPPPPDPALAWLTVTPDPGVVEVNMAPEPTLAGFLRQGRAIYAAAAEAGLGTVRYRWNGDASDSGGGGQLTFGGPTPAGSPFFAYPHLLPRLLRYLQRSPSLSYAFGMECLGSAGQAPRPDEGAPDHYHELGVALERCERGGAPADPAALWGLFGPLLVDPSGNSHRAEVNVEKLWNPHLPGRGRLGLVELRALRMQPTPERMAAVAALFRALLARLALAPDPRPPVDHRGRLHAEASLPEALFADLVEVLGDLERHGLRPGPLLCAELLARPEPVVELRDEGAVLTVRRAASFWPLVGDVASQELRAARVVDSSTARIELRLAGPAAARGRLFVEGLPLGGRVLDAVDDGPVSVAGVRWRVFAPRPGFHLDVAPHDPLRIVWTRPGRAIGLALHGWRPGGGPYPALPTDAAEAAARRRERVVTTTLAPDALPPPGAAGAAVATDYLDLLRHPTGATA